jgi:glutaredoxin
LDKGTIARFFVALALIAAVAWFTMQPAMAQTLNPTHPVDIYQFWGDGCPYCALARPFLDGLVKQYPQIRLHEYEVWHIEENQKLFAQMATAYGFEPHVVPTIFIGDRYYEGYTDSIAQDITQAVMSCRVDGCKNAGLCRYTRS